MQRRLRSKRLRRLLFVASGGLCGACGCELRAGWHVDHIVPWSACRETKLENLQALCPTCNLSKGDARHEEIA